MRLKILIALTFLFAIAIGYTNCSPTPINQTLNGTETTNPMVEFSFDSFEKTDVELAGCFTSLRLKRAGSLNATEISLGRISLTLKGSGTRLYQAQVESGIYEEIELKLSPECAAKSLQVTNLTGPYSSSEPLTLKFVGHSQVEGTFVQIGLNVTSLIENLSEVTVDSEVKTQAETAVGQWTALPPGWTTSSYASEPLARNFHSTVWTGSEIIVFGGVGAGIPAYGNGGRLDPHTSRWLSMSTLNAPSPRLFHGAVWTGNEVIVWGGEGAGATGRLNTGARYNPLTDTWTPTSMVGAPSARSQFATVWTGTEMIIYSGTFPPMGGGARYNPATDSWSAMSTLNEPGPCVLTQALWTGTEMLVWGCGAGAMTGGRYNPATDTWTPMSTTGQLSERVNDSVVWTGSEMIVWGGEDDATTTFQDGAKYNPSTNTWTPISMVNAPSPRSAQVAVWTGSKMIVWGGWNGRNNSPKEFYRDGGIYDPATDSWTLIQSANAPMGRLNPTAVWTGFDFLIWSGGDFSGTYFSDGSRFVP
jgi:hypothetical protein